MDIEGMKNKKLILFYITWGMLSTLFFIYILFPQALLKEVVTQAVQSQNKDITLSFDTVTPILPPGLRMSDVNVAYTGTPLFQANHIDVKPGLVSLVTEKKKVGITADALGGFWEADIGYKAASGTTELDVFADIKEVHLEELPVRDLLFGYGVQGLLSLKGEGNMLNRLIKTGNCQMMMTDVVVDINNRLPGLKSLTFQKIDMQAEIRDNRLELTKGDISGKEANGTLSGFITIKFPFSRSILDIRGTVRPQPDFIKNISRRLPMGLLFSKMSMKKGIPFFIQGTIAEPDVDLDMDN